MYTVSNIQDNEHYNLLLQICDAIEGTKLEICDFLTEFDPDGKLDEYDDYELLYMLACAGRIIWTEKCGWTPYSSLSKASRKVAEEFIKGNPVHGEDLSNLEVTE
jgi:hypothetical protein